jgi:hypothetical protein
MRTTVPLYFGPSALSRTYCETCEEETLHLRGQCVHVERLHAAPKASRTPTPSIARSWRADHDAMAKERMDKKRGVR